MARGGKQSLGGSNQHLGGDGSQPGGGQAEAQQQGGIGNKSPMSSNNEADSMVYYKPWYGPSDTIPKGTTSGTGSMDKSSGGPGPSPDGQTYSKLWLADMDETSNGGIKPAADGQTYYRPWPVSAVGNTGAYGG